MSSKARFDLSVPVSEATLNGWLRLNASTVSTRQPESIQRIASYFSAIAGGPFAGSIVVTTGAVQAAGLVTITTTGPVADETMTVANVTLTAVASGAVAADGEFNVSATNSVVATGIAAAINAVAALDGIVTATSSLGVVTITAVAPGTIGNGLDLTEAMTNTAVTAFAGGVDGTVVTVSNGY